MSSSKEFMALLEPTDLYNILNQCFKFPAVSDPTYLLLVDAREKHEYNESHVVTAKQAPQNSQGEYVLPYDAELECKKYVVVYDGSTDSLNKTDTKAYQCAKVFADAGSRNPVLILNGGYKNFSALYPFLRTQKIIWLPQELDDIKTYPLEIVPGLLYLGNHRQGNAPYIQKDLKIEAHINCSSKDDEIFTEDGQQLMRINVTDEAESDIKKHLANACAFIDTHKDKKHAVLVYSDLGFSRAALLCIAYLAHSNRASVQESYDTVKRCNMYACPNTGFLDQLNQWYKETIGSINEQ